MKMKRFVLFVLAILMMTPFLLGSTNNGCSEADVASKNLSIAAEQFEIMRRIVFVNGITDTWILQVEGKCSVEFYTDKFEVTCKTPEGTYLKHYLGRADNVFPFVEQLDPAKVSKSHYRVIMRPSIIVPNIDIE